jgi:hypothetical protein
MLLATAFAVAVTPAVAGGMAEPIMEDEVIVEEAAASAPTGILLPLLLLLVVVAVSQDETFD